MKSKSSLQLFIILLVFSFVLSSAALQTPRRLLPNTEKLSTQTTSDHKGAKKFWNGEEMFDMVEGRVDLESDDYPGTGANNRHDPKTPGTP
ncbi:uncharacterized protein LOC109802870 [Cajanus cajan]|uniref:Uncharacterized protein n=1 Tax=Cajanus cajan TaxID=3821 RepID=A0A151TAE6_CAJCA|nr:uncharacterized protein LOC109802870 [Cajanus cajan]KYP63984.1 hypothetical protein KK1_018571 [Cajanus cajan]